MSETKHNPELIAAVSDLYSRKIINKDKDIVDKTGYKKSTVSGYISGNVKASEDFLREFENQFGIKLLDYRKEGTQEPPAMTNPLSGSATFQDLLDEKERRIQEIKDYSSKTDAMLQQAHIEKMALLAELKTAQSINQEQLKALHANLKTGQGQIKNLLHASNKYWEDVLLVNPGLLTKLQSEGNKDNAASKKLKENDGKGKVH